MTAADTCPSWARAAALAWALAALLPCPGCGGSPAAHPAVGRVVGDLPLVSLVEPARPAPTFTGKVTLLNFWGTWCPPCRRELPGMARIAGRLADEPAFQLVAVSCGGGGADDITELTETTLAYLAEQRVELDPWGDPDGRARLIFAESFGFGAYPTTYLVGPDARVRAVWIGYRSRDEADMARAVVAALKDRPAAAAPAGR